MPITIQTTQRGSFEVQVNDKQIEVSARLFTVEALDELIRALKASKSSFLLARLRHEVGHHESEH
jgi:hypothetical protein